LDSHWIVHAYERETHEQISLKAVDQSRLDVILKSQYAVDKGIQELASGNSIRKWIGTGANQEDVPFTRALNHFHNPLLPWGQAGLPLSQSSVLWQQNPDRPHPLPRLPDPAEPGGPGESPR
jgi:hypothetical protein